MNRPYGHKDKESTCKEVYPVGDCSEPRSIAEALLEGYRAGQSI